MEQAETAIGTQATAVVATPPESSIESLLTLLEAGGPVVLILVGLSVIMLATALIKFGQFLRVGVWRRTSAERAVALVRQGRADEAVAVARNGRGEAARIVGAVIGPYRRSDLKASSVREEATRMIDETAERLRSSVRILEVIASLAPLLGLFGTVLGMIDAFQNLESSGSRADPAILSGGIWEALLTTAVGLAVAMPAVVLVNLIDRSIESFVADLDNMVAQIFNPGVASGAQSPEHQGAAHGLHQPLPAGE